MSPRELPRGICSLVLSALSVQPDSEGSAHFLGSQAAVMPAMIIAQRQSPCRLLSRLRCTAAGVCHLECSAVKQTEHQQTFLEASVADTGLYIAMCRNPHLGFNLRPLGHVRPQQQVLPLGCSGPVADSSSDHEDRPAVLHIYGSTQLCPKSLDPAAGHLLLGALAYAWTCFTSQTVVPLMF